MRKILLISVINVVFFAHVCAQIDTLRGRVPYWHYNFYDSTWCQSHEYQGALYYMGVENSINNRLGSLNVNDTGQYMGWRGSYICIYNDESQEVAIRMDMDSSCIISGLVFGYNNTCYWGTGIIPHQPCVGEPSYNTADYIFNIYDEWMNMIWSDTIATGDLRIDYYMEAGFDMYYKEDAYMVYMSSHTAGYEAPFYIGLCKVDFDTTILVPATFYVGLTSTTPTNVQNDTLLMVTAIYEFYHTMYQENDSISLFPYETRRYRIAAQSSGEEIHNWADEECHYGVQTCLYPILALPCTEVTGLRCQAVGGAGTVAMVEWDGGANNAVYEVSYGPQGTPPGGGTVTTVSQPRFLQSLDRNAHYDFYVRARCDLADTTWTDWSGPLHVHLATAGIDGAEHVEWSLTPNPAHGSATVRCEEGIRSVELLTVKGERIQYQEMAGERTCTLDLGALAKGVYIVQVTTAQGTAARKLAVE